MIGLRWELENLTVLSDLHRRAIRLALDRDSAALGATCRCVSKNSFGGMAMDAVYVSFDRPHVAAVKTVRGPGILESFAATLRQDPVGNQTRVTYRYNFETRPRFLRRS